VDAKTILGSCPICEREIAVRVVAGCYELVHHGYRRPGDGQIYGDCFGVGYAPYERSVAVCEAYKTLKQAGVPALEARLAKLEGGEVGYIRTVTFGRRALVVHEYVAGVTEYYRWEGALRVAISDVRHELFAARHEIARMDRLIAGFELRELGSETRYSAERRAAREARAAERAAKRAARDAKAKALAEKKARVEGRAEDIKARYLAELEALAERAAATDEVGSRVVAREAEGILVRMAKECKKTPRVRFYMRDWRRDDLFIQLGLARRDRGYVHYNISFV
jgi:hypothetical protein